MLASMNTYDADPTEDQKKIWQNKQTELRQLHEMNDNVSFDVETLDGLKYIAGVDLSFPLGDLKNAVACLIVMSFPDLKIVYKRFLETELHLPYISGYLAFREVEPLLTLIRQLQAESPELTPQIILVDGNGVLHPRQFGIASHLGVLANIPTVGVAKNFLLIRDDLDDLEQVKQRSKDELLKKGDRFALVGSKTGIIYGCALRTADKATNPVYVSQGHRVFLTTAVKVVLATCPMYRIPEPVRAADRESRAYIREQNLSKST